MTPLLFAKLMKDLDLLDKPQQKQVLDKLLLKQKSVVDTKYDKNLELFYDCLRQSKYLEISLKYKPFPTLTKDEYYRTFKAKAEHLNKFMDDVLPRPLKVTHRLKFYHLVIGLTAQYLESLEVPVTMKTLVNNLDSVEGLVNRSFPGYISAGLLSKVLSAYG